MKRGFAFVSAAADAPSLSSMSSVAQLPSRACLSALLVWRKAKASETVISTSTQMVLGPLSRTLADEAPRVAVEDAGVTEPVPLYTWLDEDRTAVMFNVYEVSLEKKEKSRLFRFAPDCGVVLRTGDSVRVGIDKKVLTGTMAPCMLYNFRIRLVLSGPKGASLFLQASHAEPAGAALATRPLEEAICHLMPYELQLMAPICGDAAAPEIVAPRAPVLYTDHTNGAGLAPLWDMRAVRLTANTTRATPDAQPTWVLPDEGLHYTKGVTCNAVQTLAVDTLEYPAASTRKHDQSGVIKGSLFGRLSATHRQSDAHDRELATAIKEAPIYHEACIAVVTRFGPLAQHTLAPPPATGLPHVPLHIVVATDVRASHAGPYNAPGNAGERDAIGVDQSMDCKAVAVVPRLAEYLVRYAVPVTPEFVGHRYAAPRAYAHVQMAPAKSGTAEGYTYDDWVKKPHAGSQADLDGLRLTEPLGFDFHFGVVPLDGTDVITLGHVQAIAEEAADADASQRTPRRALPWRFYALPISERACAAAGLGVPLEADPVESAFFIENGADPTAAPRRCALKTPAEGDAYVRRLLEANLGVREVLKKKFGGPGGLDAALKDREGAVWMQDPSVVPGEGAWKVTLPLVLFFAVPAAYVPAAVDSVVQPSVARAARLPRPIAAVASTADPEGDAEPEAEPEAEGPPTKKARVEGGGAVATAGGGSDGEPDLMEDDFAD